MQQTDTNEASQAIQPPSFHNVRLLWLAELKRLNEKMREFRAEVKRQEDVLRELYPVIAGAFRMERIAPSANDNAAAVKPRPHP